MAHLLLAFLFLSSCSSLHSLKANPSAQELFDHAQKLKEKSYYLESLTYFRRLKNRFLYSRLAKEAELAIADIYFLQEEWGKAAGAYGKFAELHPRHPKMDHVMFHLALSYFHQLPATEDRDLSLSKKTLFYLNKHLKVFPKSPHHKQSKEHKKKVLNLLAKKEWMIAYFHLKQEKPKSALPYLIKLLKNYSYLLPKEEKNTSKNLKVSSDLPSLKKLKQLVQEIKKQG